jgi:hypothetical protein
LSKGAVVFLMLVAALLLSTHYWPEYVIIHSPGQLIFEVPKQIVQIAISAVLLCASIYVALASAYGPQDRHWAYGMVGTIVGFWFR